jgi:hypothetical protein
MPRFGDDGAEIEHAAGAERGDTIKWLHEPSARDMWLPKISSGAGADVAMGLSRCKQVVEDSAAPPRK